jgi:glycosyltransferase involved in cell wall biosynthesis
MKILCLVDWQASNRWLWEYLPHSEDQVDFLFIRQPADKYAGYGKLLSYYPQYGWLGMRALPRMKKYDVVVTWEGKNGVPLAFLRSLSGIRKPPMMIINFVLKGQVVMDHLWFTRFAMRSVDMIACVSKKEMEYYSAELRLPLERFTQILTFHPDYHRRIWPQYQDFILAAGRSHRDYKTFVQAVDGLPLKAIINARPFNIEGLSMPENVHCNPFLPRDEFTNLVRNTRFAVLPLYPAKHASGETFLLEAMSAGKPVIATETYSTVEFIQEGVNGFLVPAGDFGTMREKILFLYHNPDIAQRMGKAARKFYEANCSFPVTAYHVDRILHQLVKE